MLSSHPRHPSCTHSSTEATRGVGQGPQGGQWADFLWGLVIGAELALASYSFGLHCALAVDRFLLAGGRGETRPLSPRRSPAVQALHKAEQQRERDSREEQPREGHAARLVDQVSSTAPSGP